MKKKKSIGSVFIELLSDRNDEITQQAALHVDDIVKSDVCAELFDILVINALGYKCPINETTIDNAVEYILSQKCKEIDASSFSETVRNYEKQQWSDFYILVGSGMKNRFKASGLLNEA